MAMTADRHPRIADDDCRACAAHPDAPCPACHVRRQHAVRLVEQSGLSVAEAARRLRLTPARVDRLLEEHADRRAVAALRQTKVDNELLRELLERRRTVEPELT